MSDHSLTNLAELLNENAQLREESRKLRRHFGFCLDTIWLRSYDSDGGERLRRAVNAIRDQYALRAEEPKP